ncbi:MAG TPA: hypothetical protein VFT74_15585, partial [Isosphaeraceae bacterium]|nr:hypothetical protein [Isosphaeraceae bacterium]
QQFEQANRDQDAALARWNALWSALGLEPRSPREMLSWHRDFERLAAKLDEQRQEKSRLEDDSARLEALCSGLAASLASVGLSRSTRELTLADLADRAEAFVEAEKQRVSDRKRLMRDLEKETQNLKGLREEEAELLRALQEWRAAWSNALEPLGLTPETGGQDALRILDLIQSALGEYERLNQLRQQLDIHAQETLGLETEAREFAAWLVPDLKDKPLDRLIADLDQRLQEATDIKSRRESLISNREIQLDKARQARETLSLALARLQELAEEAGVSSVEDLPAAIEKAQSRLMVEAEIFDIEGRVRHLSAGQDINTFVADAEQEIPRADSLSAIVQSLESEIDQLKNERNAAADSETEARVKLQQMDDTAKQAAAYSAAIQAQQILARIDSQTHRYVRTKLAASLLRQAVEAYRARSQAPVLKRASNLFATLTYGSFSGLDTELDDNDQPHIVGKRPDGSRLTISQMSEGTCDQLYLALKLSSLEHDLDHGTAFPFVADDILVNFDDQRAEAALRVLADLSKRTQVLFFTHHEHLVRLAQ